jgi:hypothetical protein
MSILVAIISNRTVSDSWECSLVSLFLHTIGIEIILLEHREETESQSDYSTTTSTTTNASQNDQLPDHNRTKKHRKQHHVSIGPTTIARKPTSIDAITNNLSQPPPATTVESHFNRDQFSPPPPVPTRRIRSPIISSTSSSDTEIEDNVVNHTHSTSPAPSSTLDHSHIQSISDRNTLQTTTTTNETHNHHSIDHTRPPARLEKRDSPVSVTPERPIKSQEETNENDAFSFFD